MPHKKLLFVPHFILDKLGGPHELLDPIKVNTLSQEDIAFYLAVQSQPRLKQFSQPIVIAHELAPKLALAYCSTLSAPDLATAWINKYDTYVSEKSTFSVNSIEDSESYQSISLVEINDEYIGVVLGPNANQFVSDPTAMAAVLLYHVFVKYDMSTAFNVNNGRLLRTVVTNTPLLIEAN